MRCGITILADLARDIAKGMEVDSEWQMEISDELGKPIYRLKVVSESLA
jgi:hypothetical protein